MKIFDKKEKKSLLKMLKESFSGLTECEDIDLDQSFRLGEKKVRLPLKNFPLQINLGPDRTVLHIYPERPIDRPARETYVEDYIVFDPLQYYKNVSGFIRLCSGDKLILGKNQGDQKHLINLPQNLSTRHLSIANDNGKLIFKKLEEKDDTCIAPLLKDKALNKISKWRIAKLKRIRSIYGGPLKKLAPDDALDLIRNVNEILGTEEFREKDSRGKPGAVVELPSNMTPILVGDLHTKINNLLVILSQNGFLEAMKKKCACLIILGDAVHNEEQGEYEEMDSSMLLMDFIFKLKICFPGQVFYLRGNHDSFSEEIGKGGVPQGLLWEKALLKERGKEYRDEMHRLYNRLAYIAFSKKFIACHAAPPVSSVSQKKLINLHERPELIGELINNRLRKPNRPSGYFKSEIKKFRKCFNLDENTAVIVGHTPISTEDTIWMNISDIDNHHVIYASNKNVVGVMVKHGNRMFPLIYPVEDLLPIINNLELKDKK